MMSLSSPSEEIVDGAFLRRTRMAGVCFELTRSAAVEES